MKDDRSDYLHSPGREVPTERFNVLIAYEDAEAGVRARRLFSELEHEFGDGLRFRAYPWRFDLIANPGYDQFTLPDGIKAHLLLVSTSSEAALPPGVQRWITACLAGRSDGKGALIALFGKEGHLETDNSPRLEFLSESSQKSEWDSLWPRIERDRPLLAIPFHSESRAESVTWLIEQIIHPSLANRP